MTDSSTETTSSGDSTGDVIDDLMTDHREVTQLIAQIYAADDAEDRREYADQLISELVRHSVAEEMWVYPAMRDHVPGGAEAVDHDTEEHKQLEATMKELEGADASDSQFLEVLGRLEALLADHVTDEETEQFPKIRQHVPQEQLEQLKSRVEVAKKIAPTRPHPLSPNAELFHKVVGPGVGLVDRLRDKLTGRNA